MNADTIRYLARNHIRGNWGAMTLISSVITIILITVGILSIWHRAFLILYIILPPPLAMALVIASNKAVRNECIDLSVIIKGFKDFKRATAAGFLTNIYILLRALLFIYPSIVSRYSYAMTFYILADDLIFRLKRL